MRKDNGEEKKSSRESENYNLLSELEVTSQI